MELFKTSLKKTPHFHNGSQEGMVQFAIAIGTITPQSQGGSQKSHGACSATNPSRRPKGQTAVAPKRFQNATPWKAVFWQGVQACDTECASNQAKVQHAKLTDEAET